jgi:hypothetical protein
MPVMHTGDIHPGTGQVTFPPESLAGVAGTASTVGTAAGTGTITATSSGSTSIIGINLDADTGEGVYVNCTGNGTGVITLNFKSIVAGDGIELTADANSITISNTGVSGIADVSEGGTGDTTFPQNGILVGNGTEPLLTISAPTVSGQVLSFNGTAYEWVTPVAGGGGSISASQITGLATVATTGSYTDLINTPTIPAAQINSDWDATSGIAQILNKPTLAAVATTGSYTDLSNTPTIPAAQVNSDWNATSGVAQILNQPILATVATTGKYSDLLNAPDLAAVATSGSYTDLSNTPTPYALPPATTTSLGGVIVGNGLNVGDDGTLSVVDSGPSNVHSVALSLPSIFAVSGSPVTSTGTLTGVLLSQNANTFFSGPTNGSAGIPTFRTISSADIPSATTSSQGAVIVGNGLTVTNTGLLAAVMTSFDGRIGDIVMQPSDLIVPYVQGSTNPDQGAFLLDSPRFTGTPTAPTPALGDNSANVATTEFVTDAINNYNLAPATTNAIGGVLISNGLEVTANGTLTANMLSFNGRVGAIITEADDLIVPYVQGSNNPDQGAFLLPSPRFLGTPTAVTPAIGDNSTALATTAFVQSAWGQAAVTSFDGRVGAITLQASDVSSAGGALLAGPAFSGNPTAPTPAAGDNSGSIATTAFVQNAFQEAAVVTFEGRSGTVTLESSDISSAGGALLASPQFTGNPTAPTQPSSDNSSLIATTAFVQSLINTEGVLEFNGRIGDVTLVSSDVTVPFVEGVENPNAGAFFLDSPRFTGNATAPTPAAGDSSTSLATTAFVQATVSNAFTPVATTSTLGGVIVSNGLAVSANGTLTADVLSVAGRVGNVTLSVSDVAGAVSIDSPAFTGNPTAPGPSDQSDSSITIANTAFVQKAAFGSSSINIGTNGTNPTGGAIPADSLALPIIELGGGLQADTTVTLPTSGRWIIYNGTGGAFSVTLSTGTGPTMDLPQGATVEVVTMGGVYPANQLGITRPANDSTKYLATTEYISNAIGQFSSGVASFNTRTGAIVLNSSDVSGVGGALLVSPAFTGVPTAPTAVFGTNTNQLATTEFVTTNFAPLISPALAGSPTAPDIGSQNGTSSGIVSVNYANSIFAPLISPALKGSPTAPTPAIGDSSTSIATTAFMERYLINLTSVSVTNANITLTPVQYGSELIEFNGTLTASVIVTIPSTGQWMFYNNTLGNYTVTISNGQGATYVVPQDQSAIVMSLGDLGVINANIAGNFITPATTTTIGGVIVPNDGGLSIDNNGNLSVQLGSASDPGLVSQGSGVTINSSGVLSANVLTVAGRVGNVTLSTTDISGIANYAPLASPAFTGVPTVPTATPSTNTSQVANTAYVTNAVTTAVNNVVSTLQTPATVGLGLTNITITQTQAESDILILQGTLGANVTVNVPTTGQWTVYNTTTGAFSVTLSNGTGNTVAISQGMAIAVLSNPSAGIIQLTSTAPTQQVARIGVNIQGNPLVINETFYPVVSPFTLPANLVGANAICNFNSGTTATVNVMHYVGSSTPATQIGSITFTSGASPVFTTTGGTTVSFSSGDTLSYQFPTGNLSLFASTLVGVWN